MNAARITVAVLSASYLVVMTVPARADIVDETALTRRLAQELVARLRAPSPPATPKDAAGPAPAWRAPLESPTRPAATPSGAGLDPLINDIARRHGINPAFVRAVIAVESGYDVRALSPKGAMGLMQLMPGTAAALGVRDPWDPAANIDGGVRYLAEQLAIFGTAELALVAYNAGPQTIRRGWRVPDETRAYVQAVMARFRAARAAAR